MTINEINNYLESGSTKSICIDCSLSAEYPGFVRELYIQAGNIVKLVFNVYGYDEGGLSIKISYDNLQSLIHSLEEYTGLPMEMWENFTRTSRYPELPSVTNDVSKSGRFLKKDLVDKALKLPLDGKEYSIQVGYWKNLAEGKIPLE